MFKIPTMKFLTVIFDASRKKNQPLNNIYLILYDGTELITPFTDQLGLQTAQDNSKLASWDGPPSYNTLAKTSEKNIT